jgi:hypothetical protein
MKIKDGAMTKFLMLTLLSLPGLASASNYATCLLDKLPGLENDQAAAAAIQVCRADHPGGLEAVTQGDGRGMLGYDSGADCALDQSGDTRSRTAAYQIRLACDRLYNENFFDQFDSR